MFNLQTRRCDACGDVFKLATLRARETECHGCMRKRSERITAQAVQLGRLEPVRSLGRTVDYRQAKPSTRPCDGACGTCPPVVPGQFFETRNEAERACPAGWELVGEVHGGYRVRPVVRDRPERKPVPAAAMPVAVAPPEPSVAERIEQARQRLAEQRAAMKRQFARMSGAVAGGFISQQQAIGQIQHGNMVAQVIADPTVPPGQVRMVWVDKAGMSRVVMMPITGADVPGAGAPVALSYVPPPDPHEVTTPWMRLDRLPEPSSASVIVMTATRNYAAESPAAKLRVTLP